MVEVFTSQNHRISVPLLGRGWLLEQHSSTTQTKVLARLTVPGQFALLLAEDNFHESLIHDATTWMGLRQAEYTQKYESVTCNYLEQTDVNGLAWLEASLEITIHSRLAPLNKIERILVEENHGLVLSMEAQAKDFRKYWLETQRWFNEVRFTSLQQGN